MVPQGARAKDVSYWQAQEAKDREKYHQRSLDNKHTASGTADGRDGDRGDNNEGLAGGEHWGSEKEEVRSKATSIFLRSFFRWDNFLAIFHEHGLGFREMGD